jgi:hypothetical protein
MPLGFKSSDHRDAPIGNGGMNVPGWNLPDRVGQVHQQLMELVVHGGDSCTSG